MPQNQQKESSKTKEKLTNLSLALRKNLGRRKAAKNSNKEKNKLSL